MHSGRADGEHFARNGGLSATSRASAPSQRRKTFGFLFDCLNNKKVTEGTKTLVKENFSRPIIQAMLVDRPGITCIPICLLDDLAPYANRINIIV